MVIFKWRIITVSGQTTLQSVLYNSSSFQRSKLCEGVLLVILMMEGIYLFKFRPAAFEEKLSDCWMKVSRQIWEFAHSLPVQITTEIMILDQM